MSFEEFAFTSTVFISRGLQLKNKELIANVRQGQTVVFLLRYTLSQQVTFP